MDKPVQEIKLNDEVLKQYGFKNDHNNGDSCWMKFYIGKASRSLIPNNDFMLFDYDESHSYYFFNFGSRSARIKDLATLKQLYFILMDEELTPVV